MQLKQEILQGLKTSLRGILALPGDPVYDETRSLWNGMIDRKPAVVVRCQGVADVLTCVNFSRENNLPLSIKGGGHNIAGLAACDDGLMIDMSLMRGVWVDPMARTARAQAGCLLGDLDRETQVHGLATVLGFVSNTGIAGLTLGGGFGYLTRKHGWTSDNVVSMDIVTADARVVRASEKENAELFWGLRGGGGNFGIVTNFEYRLHPVGPQVIAGVIAWRAEEATKVLELYRSLVAEASPELTCAAIWRIAPPAPWLSPAIHGKPIVALAVCHSGSLEEGLKAAAPIKSLGSPVGDIIQQRSYVSQQCILDLTQPKGRRYYWKSEFLARVGPELLARITGHAKGILSPHSGIVLFPVDGALNRLPENHSSVGNRDAACVLNITSSWERAQDDAAHIEWTRAAWRDMRGFSTGGTYINFLTEEEGDDRIHAAYGKNYDRLARLKKEWDPGNLFRINKNITPT